ncbi:MAG: ChaN family lipoprotein [Bacteroidales bacterium]
MEKSFPPETIIETATGHAVSFETMMAELNKAKIVYVGEQHNNAAHHDIQLRIAEELSAFHPDLSVGMEMFAHTYQPVLTQWSQGAFNETQFLEKTHWYANWKFDFALYRDLLNFFKDHRIPLIGLNIPFFIPPKIAVGGIDNLLPAEKAHLPESIDISDQKHREYVKSIFRHHHHTGLSNFEYFYAAQCVWEDAMAETIVKNLNKKSPFLVFAGNGHLRHHYGIPLRVHKRRSVPYRIVIPMASGNTVDAAIADYIWVTAPQSKRHQRTP